MLAYEAAPLIKLEKDLLRYEQATSMFAPASSSLTARRPARTSIVLTFERRRNPHDDRVKGGQYISVARRFPRDGLRQARQ